MCNFDEYTYRRIHPQHEITDKNTGLKRISSGAFTLRPGEEYLSIAIGSLIAENDKEPIDITADEYGFPGYGLVGIKNTDLGTEFPIKEDADELEPWHGLIDVEKITRKQSKKLQKRISQEILKPDASLLKPKDEE